MRRAIRTLGTLMMIAGVGSLGWAVLVWQWQDPLTLLVEHREQGKLEQRYDERSEQFRVAPARLAKLSEAELAAIARRYRRSLRQGDPVGKLTIGRLGLEKVIVNGTDHDSLTKGPGRDPRTFMPGERKLVYVAGHRTTYGAPFSNIDDIRRGDYVTLEVPYALFKYRVTGHVIVPANDIGRLQSRNREEIALQACEPRFFASHRYIVYAKLVGFEPRADGAANVAVAASQ